MLRLVIFFVVILAVAVGAAWLADRPGEVALEWQGYAVEFGLMTAIIGLVALVLLVVFLHGVWRAIVRTPSMFGDYIKGRRRDRGYAALSKGMIALGAGDAQTARKMANDAARLLPREPMTRLLKAQAAQATGNRDEAASTFSQMLESSDTRLLGLRGLYLEAKRSGNDEAALHYADEALGLAPGVPWAGNALFEYQCARHDWEGALKTLQIHTEKQIVDKAVARRRRAVLLTALGLEKEDGEPDMALQLASEAHGLDMSLVPAATLAARLSTRLGNVRRASSVIEQSWRVAPHPELAEAYSRVRPGDSVRDRYRRIRGLSQKAAFHRESKLALAAAAIDAQDWKTARDTLMTLAKTEPTVRVCELMARVEEGEHGDHGRAREWLARAVHAMPDPVWTADGRVSDHWMPTSPVTGRLDAFEWKVPVEAMEPLPDRIIEQLGAPVGVPVAAPAASLVATGGGSATPATTAPTAAAAEASAAPTAADTVEETRDGAAMAPAVAPPQKTAAGPQPPQPVAPPAANVSPVATPPSTAAPTAGTAAKGDRKDPKSGPDEPSKPVPPIAAAAAAADGTEAENVTPIRPPDDPGSDDTGLDDGPEATAKKRFGLF